MNYQAVCNWYFISITLEKLPKELSIWQKMCHPNIIRLLDHTSDTRWTYSIMEYFPGGDLDDWLLTNDKVGPELSRHWLFQLVSALRHLKKLGYAHGDVKPKNVLVVGEKLLKLCDFGCMKPLNEGLSTSFCGSFGYVAPEIFRKEPHDPEKADVWSYGEDWGTYDCNPERSLTNLFFNWHVQI